MANKALRRSSSNDCSNGKTTFLHRHHSPPPIGGREALGQSRFYLTAWLRVDAPPPLFTPTKPAENTRSFGISLISLILLQEDLPEPFSALSTLKQRVLTYR